MNNEAGGGHHLAIAKKGGVFLRAGWRAENVARVDREIDQETSHFLAFANSQFTRSRLAQELDLRTLRIPQAGVEPVGDDLLVVRWIGAVSLIGGGRGLGKTARLEGGQDARQEKPF